MVAAQKINEDETPILSQPYVVTSSDIFDLFAVLEFIKAEMEEVYKNLQ